MKLLLSYLREHRPVVLAALLSPLVFLLIFFLYGLKTEPFLYAALLNLMIWLILFGIRFPRYCKDHARRELLKNSIMNQLPELPEAHTLPERDYLLMIQILEDRIRRITDKNAAEQLAAQDYYTLWVHQIKTPIAAMRMMLQSEEVSGSSQLEAELFRIEQYAEMALQYIRLESSGNDLDFRLQKLDPLIRSCIRKFAPAFNAKKLRIQYDGTDAEVLTDEKWLSFILEQLLSNAVKYTQSGIVSVKVTDPLLLEISDTGIGIASSDLPRIFEKGFTGQNGRTDHLATGLGLYLCGKAARKIGVTISARSQVGEGSVFSVDLAKENTQPD